MGEYLKFATIINFYFPWNFWGNKSYLICSKWKKLAWKWKLNLAKISYTKSTALTLWQGITLSRNHILFQSFCWLWTGKDQRLWFYHLLHISEAVLHMCSHKRMFWKYAVNLPENTHVRVWFPKSCKATLLRNHTSAWGSSLNLLHIIRTPMEGYFWHLYLVTDVIALNIKPKLKHFQVSG